MSARRLGLAVAAALTALAVGGCAKLEAKFTPEPQIITAKAVVASAKASVVGTLSPGMPDNVPLWPNSEIVSSSSSQQSYDLTLRTSDQYDDVLAGVAKGFESAGWEIMQEDPGTDGTKSAVLTVVAESSQGIITVSDSAEVTNTVDIAYVFFK